MVWLFTDGIKYLADWARAYWLIDLVASYQPQVKKMPFQLWKIVVNKDDDTAIVTMRQDSDRENEVKQEISFTDFPLKELEFYVTDNVMLRELPLAFANGLLD